MNKNISGSSVEVPEMIILIKDHKQWTPEKGGVIPSRPVVSGSRGINTHLSEWLSEILEPIANNMRSGEVASTEETLSIFDEINREIDANTDTPHDDVLQTLSLKNTITKEQEQKIKEWEAITDFKKLGDANIKDPKTVDTNDNELLLTVLDDLIETGHKQRDTDGGPYTLDEGSRKDEIFYFKNSLKATNIDDTWEEDKPETNFIEEIKSYALDLLQGIR